MQFCIHAVFYLKKALKQSEVYMFHWWGITVCTDLGTNPESSSLQMDPWHLHKIPLKSIGLYMGAGAHCKISTTQSFHYSEFRLWQNPKYLVLWNSNTFLLLQYIKSSRLNLGHIYSTFFLWIYRIILCHTGKCVNLTSILALHPKYSKKKVQ